MCEIDPRHNESVGRAGLSRENFCDEIARALAYRYVPCLINVCKYPLHNKRSTIAPVCCPQNPLRSHSFHLCGYIIVTTVIIVDLAHVLAVKGDDYMDHIAICSPTRDFESHTFRMR